MSELHNYYPPELANRFFDTLTIQKSLSKILLDFPAAALQIIFGLILLSLYHPFFIIYGLLLVVLIYVVFKYTAKKGLETSLMESKHKYRVAHWIQEVARTIISFKLSGKTSHAIDRGDELVAGYLDSRESHFKILMLQFAQMIGFKVLVTAGLLLIGGILVLNQEMNIGQFVAAEIIILLIISSVEKLIMGLESFYDVLTSFEKLGQVVDKKLEPQEGTRPFKEDEDFTVEFENVSYSYPDDPTKVLKNVSLKITPGCTILIQGTNGSGKSTLLKLIAGILEPTEGNIYVNDHRLSGINLNYYRSHLGQSFTEESPFEGTLLDNITFADKSIEMDQVMWAIKTVGLQEFVKKQPKGIHTMIYPEGKRIPYTIAKKIVLARSILRKPRLLILKDPLDQMDKSEAERIMNFLTDRSNPWALVVASQNTDWKKHCGRIIRLEEGNAINL